MRILGLDVGEKRIGVARADSNTRIAVPVGYLSVDGSEWQEIARLASLNSTNVFIIGLPRSNEGTETQQSLYVRNFAQALLQRMPGAKIRFQDESLTSVVAEDRLKNRGKPYEKGDIDAEAAAIILQDFLESIGSSESFSSGSLAVIAPAVAPMSSEKTPEELQAVKNLAKKQADKVKLNTKKAKHKMKTATKWITGVAIVAILALIGTGVALIIKEERHQEYLAWLAEQEARLNSEGVFNFTILPGETIYDIKQKLINVGYSTTEVEQALNGSYDYTFLRERPAGATLEGYLYGETHEFYKDTPVREIIDTYLKGMEQIIKNNNLEARYAARGLSLFEGITLASVVQKESVDAEMPTVAQVFLTRLDNGMALGSDVTVSYAIDTIDPDRQVYNDNNAALTVDSCYNTRLYRGLPCGPISNPGLSALLAVAEPTDTSYLYFLTGDDGLMYYSYTEDEHIQNTYSHCQNLCSVSL